MTIGELVKILAEIRELKDIESPSEQEKYWLNHLLSIRLVTPEDEEE